MSDSPEPIEFRLRAELDEAENQLRAAKPEQKPEARERFKHALHRFTRMVLYGELPG